MVATSSAPLSPVPQVVPTAAAAGKQIPPRPVAGATGRTVSTSDFRSVMQLGRPVAAIPARPERKRGSGPELQKERNAGMTTHTPIPTSPFLELEFP